MKQRNRSPQLGGYATIEEAVLAIVDEAREIKAGADKYIKLNKDLTFMSVSYSVLQDRVIIEGKTAVGNKNCTIKCHLEGKALPVVHVNGKPVKVIKTK